MTLLAGHRSMSPVARLSGPPGLPQLLPVAAADLLDVRGLAALYTGFATASELAWAGLARGAPEALARASAVFAGPPPWMAEVF